MFSPAKKASLSSPTAVRRPSNSSPKATTTAGVSFSYTTSPSGSPTSFYPSIASATSVGSASSPGVSPAHAGAVSPDSPNGRLKQSIRKLSINTVEGTTVDRDSPSAGQTKSSTPTAVKSKPKLSVNPSAPTISTSMSASAAAAAAAKNVKGLNTKPSVMPKAAIQSPTASRNKAPVVPSSLSTLPPSMVTMNNVDSTPSNLVPHQYSSTPTAASMHTPPPARTMSNVEDPSSPIASASSPQRKLKAIKTPTSAIAGSPIASVQQPAVTTPVNIRKNSIPRKINYEDAAAIHIHGTPPNQPTIFSPQFHLAAQKEEEARKEKEEAAAKLKSFPAPIPPSMQRIIPRMNAINAAKAKGLKPPSIYQNPYPNGHEDGELTEEDFDPFLFIKHLPPLSPAMRNRRSPLPKKLSRAPPLTLALDLDETLVHCSVQPIERAELTFNVSFNGMEYEVYVRTRPHLQQFLQTVSQWFEVLIFTASQKVYADKLLNILDPKHEYIQHRVFRDSCVCVDGNYLKDLHILGREIPQVAIIDNSVQAFGFQLDNGIPIESWFDDDSDNELLNLLPFLKQLKDQKDVRPLIKSTFRLSEFVASL